VLGALLEPASVDLLGLSLVEKALAVLEVVVPVPPVDALVQVEESALALLEPLDEFALVPLVVAEYVDALALEAVLVPLTQVHIPVVVVINPDPLFGLALDAAHVPRPVLVLLLLELALLQVVPDERLDYQAPLLFHRNRLLTTHIIYLFYRAHSSFFDALLMYSALE
jgi:hypothetical protein